MQVGDVAEEHHADVDVGIKIDRRTLWRFLVQRSADLRRRHTGADTGLLR